MARCCRFFLISPRSNHLYLAVSRGASPLHRTPLTMDGNRKYRQHGYQDSGKMNGSSDRKDQYHEGEYYGSRPPLDVPRIPRMVRSVAASRCFSCSNQLPAGFDFLLPCPKCGAALHVCSQCGFMDSSARFQCSRPIGERVAYKDKLNECSFFAPRITVARETNSVAPAVNRPSTPISAAVPVPRKVQDARAAFEDLFKKLPE